MRSRFQSAKRAACRTYLDRVRDDETGVPAHAYEHPRGVEGMDTAALGVELRALDTDDGAGDDHKKELPHFEKCCTQGVLYGGWDPIPKKLRTKVLKGLNTRPAAKGCQGTEPKCDSRCLDGLAVFSDQVWSDAGNSMPSGTVLAEWSSKTATSVPQLKRYFVNRPSSDNTATANAGMAIV